MIDLNKLSIMNRKNDKTDEHRKYINYYKSDKREAENRYKLLKAGKTVDLKFSDFAFVNITEQMAIRCAMSKKNIVDAKDAISYGNYPEDIKVRKMFVGKKIGILEQDSFGYFYCADTRKWYEYDLEQIPVIDYMRPIPFSNWSKRLKQDYIEDMKYCGVSIDELN